MPETDRIQAAIVALHPLLTQLDDATAATSNARREMIAKAIRAIRQVEKNLKDALNGEPLRGMRNLTSPSNALYGMHVRKNDRGARVALDVGEKKTLLLLFPTGELVSVDVSRPVFDRIEIKDYTVEDIDLRAEDLPAFLHTVVEAIDQHMRASRVTVERNRKLRKLADAVLLALG